MRYYYCQNWRADVSAIVNASGKMMEWIKYSSYGIPFGLPAGDTDSDGDCDQTDINNIDNWVSAYDVRYDLDLDGDVDAADSSRASTTFQGTTLGWSVLSSSSVGNRRGYAGYEWDEAVSKYHVRNRVLDPTLGRWTRRDPLGYIDGMSLYEYVGSRVLTGADPNGTATSQCTQGSVTIRNYAKPCGLFGGKWRKCSSCHQCKFSFRAAAWVWSSKSTNSKCGKCKYWDQTDPYPTIKCVGATRSTDPWKYRRCQIFQNKQNNVNCHGCCQDIFGYNADDKNLLICFNYCDKNFPG